MIKIKTQSTKIPIEFGELKFEADISDANMAQLRQKWQDFDKQLATLEKATLTEQEESDANDVLKAIFNDLLGADAFARLYEQTPSVTLLGGYLVQVIEGIDDIINEAMRVEKAQKYLRRA